MNRIYYRNSNYIENIVYSIRFIQNLYDLDFLPDHLKVNQK